MKNLVFAEGHDFLSNLLLFSYLSRKKSTVFAYFTAYSNETIEFEKVDFYVVNWPNLLFETYYPLVSLRMSDLQWALNTSPVFLRN